MREGREKVKGTDWLHYFTARMRRAVSQKCIEIWHKNKLTNNRRNHFSLRSLRSNVHMFIATAINMIIKVILLRIGN